MNVVRTVAEAREALADRPGSVGLVPTMGAFHEGHLALIRAARAECDTVVVSLFVNPSQFGANEDLDSYPRDEARDARLAEQEGVDLLFTPSAEEMYPPGYETWVEVTELGRRLEGAVRPGHFRGRRHRLPEALQHRPAGPRLLRPEGRAASGRPQADGARSQRRPRAARAPGRPRRRRPRALVAERLPVAGGARARARAAARARHARPRGRPRRPGRARRRLRRGRRLRPALSWPPPSASAAPA